ncbi:hypothetical protein CkaCkLH20_02395 [Colletotrichum karsti]|uniref:Uncharacterized protein n=1 Tax=Colletotrichum karsti TaxID=1095194 RepID=A0A9P6LPI2_9PEZI|nr:uncharacterized protein CkaCkLH20_02395 [Colletotrichum karsti]KAF9880441.1 hypothetical protein CkaCkLH20_02395 [Colletotrichum karsti]
MLSFFQDWDQDREMAAPVAGQQPNAAQNAVAEHSLPGVFVPNCAGKVIFPTTRRKPSGAHHPVIPPAPTTIADCSLISNGNVGNVFWAPPATPAIRRPSRCRSVDANGQLIPIPPKAFGDTINAGNPAGHQVQANIQSPYDVPQQAANMAVPGLPQLSQLPVPDNTPTSQSSQQYPLQTASSSTSARPVPQARPPVVKLNSRRNSSKHVVGSPKRPGLKLRGKSQISVHDIVRKVRNHLSRHPERQKASPGKAGSSSTCQRGSCQYVLDDGQVQDLVNIVVQEICEHGHGPTVTGDALHKRSGKRVEEAKQVVRKPSCLMNATDPQLSNAADPATTINEPQTAFFARSRSDGQVRAKVRPSQASITTILSKDSITNIQWHPESETASENDDAMDVPTSRSTDGHKIASEGGSNEQSRPGLDEDRKSVPSGNGDGDLKNNPENESEDPIQVVKDCGPGQVKLHTLDDEPSPVSELQTGEPSFQGFSIGSQLVSEINAEIGDKQEKAEVEQGTENRDPKHSAKQNHQEENDPKRAHPTEMEQDNKFGKTLLNNRDEIQQGITSFPPLNKRLTNEWASPSTSIIHEERETQDMYHLGIDARPGGILPIPQTPNMPRESVKSNSSLFHQDIFDTNGLSSAHKLTRRASEAVIHSTSRPKNGSILEPLGRRATDSKSLSRSRSTHFADLPKFEPPKDEPSLLQKLTRKLSSVFQSPMESRSMRAPPPSLASNRISRKVSEVLDTTRPTTEDEEPEAGYVSEPEPSAIYQAMTLSKPAKTGRRSICSEDNPSQKVDAITSLRGLIGAGGR